MRLIIGITIFIFGFYGGIVELGQKLSSYWDFVAFSVVVGGTIAASIITSPNVRLKLLQHHLIATLFSSFSRRREKTVLSGLELIQGGSPEVSFHNFEKRLLLEGVELTELGFHKERVMNILNSRIDQFAQDSYKISSWIKNLAKYPPAFGLSGTVLGLVYLMRGISEGTSPSETGVRMAIALVATFYGIILSNVLIAPLAERIKENIDETINLCEIVLKSIELFYEKENILVAQETLNSFLTSQEKIDVIGNLVEVQ